MIESLFFSLLWEVVDCLRLSVPPYPPLGLYIPPFKPAARAHTLHSHYQSEREKNPFFYFSFLFEKPLPSPSLFLPFPSLFWSAVHVTKNSVGVMEWRGCSWRIFLQTFLIFQNDFNIPFSTINRLYFCETLGRISAKLRSCLLHKFLVGVDGNDDDDDDGIERRKPASIKQEGKGRAVKLDFAWTHFWD